METKELKIVLQSILNDYENLIVKMETVKDTGLYWFCSENKINYGLCYYFYKKNSFHSDEFFYYLRPHVKIETMYICEVIEYLPINNRKLYLETLNKRVNVLKGIIEGI
jgi:hypothetical protein